MTRFKHTGRVVLVSAAVVMSGCHRASSTTTTSPGAASASASSSGSNVPTAKGAKATLPSNVTSKVIAVGDSIYNNGSCYRCHGKAGIGSVNGPKLVARVWQHGTGSFDDIVATISRGVPIAEIKDPSHKLAMRARGGMQPLLTDDQVNAVAAYVYTISRR